MADNVDGIYNTTVPALMAHPNLLVPRAFGQKRGQVVTDPSKLKYSANICFDTAKNKVDLEQIKNIVIAVASAEWPGRAIGAEAKAGTFHFPWSNGTELADARAAECAKLNRPTDGDFQRGTIVLAGRSKFEPRLAGVINGRIVDFEGPARAANEKLFFFGALVLAQFKFVAYKGVSRNPDGVTAYLNMVVSTGQGTVIRSGKSASEVFSGYTGHDTDEDPMGGQADDSDVAF